MSRRNLLGTELTVVVPDPGTGPSGDAALFQTAIDSLASTGGIVAFSGEYTITSPITLKSGVWLVGYGWKASKLKLGDGANCHVIRTDPANVTQYAGLSSFYIDGNRGNNTSGDGVRFQNLTPGYENGQCAVNIIEDVLVEYAAGNAFTLNSGNVESRIFNAYAFSPKGYGFDCAGSDYWVENCTTGESLLDGFRIQGAGMRVSGCKAWFAGRQLPPRTNFNPGNGSGAAVGFRINAENAQVINCEAQDNSGPGAVLSGSAGRVQLHIDTNNAAGVVTNPYQLEVINCSNMHVDVNFGNSTGRFPGGYALNRGVSANGNRIELWNGCPGMVLDRPGSASVGTNIMAASGF